MKTAEQKYCHECGETINIKAEICPKCGVRQPSTNNSGFSTTASGRSRMVAAILALLLGGFGIHRFYLGKIVSGIFYLLFCWTFIPAIIAFIEAIFLLCMSDDKFAAKYP